LILSLNRYSVRPEFPSNRKYDNRLPISIEPNI